MSEPKGILKKGEKDKKGNIGFDGAAQDANDPNRKPLKRQQTAPPKEKEGQEARKQINKNSKGIVKKAEPATSDTTPRTPGKKDGPLKDDDEDKCTIQ